MENKELKIGIALGGGGAKGAAHIGVLRVFEKYGIKVSAIVGASAGSIIGGSYALGLSLDEIIKRSEKFNKSKFLRITNFHLFSESLIKSNDVEKVIQNLVGDHEFSDVKIPFTAVAVDLESGHEVALEKGKMWEALRASSAIPGVFSPYFLDEQYFVDGALLNDVPVNVLRAKHDVDMIIGVSLGSLTSRQYIAGMIWEKYYHKPELFKLYPSKLTRMKLNLTLMLNILLRSVDILREQTLELTYKNTQPDFIIHPDVERINFLEFNRYGDGIEAGIKAAEEAMPELLKIIERKKQELNKQELHGTVEPL